MTAITLLEPVEAPLRRSRARPSLTVRDLMVEAVHGFRLEVPHLEVGEGETLAIIGPNGTGKTTFIEAVLGMRRLVTGSVELLGWPLREVTRRPRLRAPLGVQLQYPSFSYDVLVRELVRLHRCLHGRVDEALRLLLGVDRLLSRTYGELSRGEQQRIDLFMALAHRPRLAFLDEPTAGLDQQTAVALRRHLTDGNEVRPAVVLVTHVPEDLRIADRILWITKGEIHAPAPPEALRLALVGTHWGEICLRRETDVEAVEEMRNTHAASVKAIIWEAPLRARIFGSENLTEIVPRMARGCQAISFGIGETTLIDLLWLASRR
jgi:ABC-2 type transport system ATP-binding protein